MMGVSVVLAGVLGLTATVLLHMQHVLAANSTCAAGNNTSNTTNVTGCSTSS